MVVEDKVLVGASKVEGVIKDIEETTGSILVEHEVTIDGRSKSVKQWYNGNTVTEVVEEKKIKPKKKVKVELGILPETEKSDSDGE